VKILETQRIQVFCLAFMITNRTLDGRQNQTLVLNNIHLQGVLDICIVYIVVLFYFIIYMILFTLLGSLDAASVLLLYSKHAFC